jgi:hypothetical protein
MDMEAANGYFLARTQVSYPELGFLLLQKTGAGGVPAPVS